MPTIIENKKLLKQNFWGNNCPKLPKFVEQSKFIGSRNSAKSEQDD